MRNFFTAIIALVFLSGCGETIPRTAIVEGEYNKYINAMKQSVGRGELAHNWQTNFSPVRLSQCKEWGILNPNSEHVRYDIKSPSISPIRGVGLGFVRFEWDLLGLKSDAISYAILSGDGVVLAWLEKEDRERQGVYNEGKVIELVQQGTASKQVYRWNRSLDEWLEAFKRKINDEHRAKMAAIEKAELMKWQKEMEAAEIKRQKEREAALAAELAADKRTIEKFRANAKPLTEKQTVAINLALKTLYKSRNIILEFIQGSLKTEKILEDIERWTIVVLERGKTKPREVWFDVEVDDSGLLHDKVSVSKVRLK